MLLVTKRFISPSGNGVHLVELLVSDDPTSHILCKLFYHLLNDTNYGPLNQCRYTALSYVRGDPSETREILVDNIRVQVTVYLEAALRATRRHQGSRILWTDAVCVNQGDIRERGGEVLRIDSIFIAACAVIAIRRSGRQFRSGNRYN